MGLSHVDAERADGATLIPWVPGKPMAWNVIVPDTYARFHIDRTSLQAGAAADNAATAKKTKYADITNTHIFISAAIETGGSWNAEADEMIQDTVKRIKIINGETRKTLIFSNASPERKCVGQSTF